MAIIRIKSGREKSLLRRHPWVFSGAIADIEGGVVQGDTVEVRSAKGEFLGWGSYSPQSQIRVRIWSWFPQTVIEPAFFSQQLERALALRQAWIDPAATNAARLVNGESDGLPGLVVDRYDHVVVMQCLSSGVERWRDVLATQLAEFTGCRTVYERSDADVRRLEGLPERCGTLIGPEPEEKVSIFENGLAYQVNVRQGHKTGFYLDQRANRAWVRRLAQGKEILDCFTYTGGFTLNACAGGASSVTAIDASPEALSLARQHAAMNAISPERIEWVEEDVFLALRGLRDRGRSFDLIVLDPPKFAANSAQVERAARGYKDINLLAFKLLRPGGTLVTFSCSGGVSEDLFQKIVAGAALDAGVDARISTHLHQDGDHPVALHFPEGAYLKGLVIRVVPLL